jgi:2-phosphosulfolactate phosphatase
VSPNLRPRTETPPRWGRQSQFDVRFEWGPTGVEVVDGHLVVIVDVLRFTTAVEAAVGRGVLVYPYRWRDRSAARFARSVGARLADGADPAGPALSPLSLLQLPAGDSVVLPSPNGATCSAIAGEAGATVIAGCLRNAAAIGEWLLARADSVSVIACGERWPDGSLRPALEDYLGAGAILAHMGGHQSSPEARAAAAAWRDMKDDIESALFACSSGRELVERGWSSDLEYAVQVNVSGVVPVLHEGAFRDHLASAIIPVRKVHHH